MTAQEFILERLKGIQAKQVEPAGDLADFIPAFPIDLVYFDAFSPDKQPSMWTREIFGRIASAMRSGGILVTYSAKGDVKRNLRYIGFDVKLLPGPPGKREMISAKKI